MFRRKSGAPNASGVAPTQRGNFPTFRRLLGRSGRFGFLFPTFRRLLGRLPFLSRAWWKRNKRRVAAACLILATIWTATDVYATVLLNRELEAIRQRGEPLTMAELAPPPVPDAQNAAILYKRAEEMLKKLGLTQDEEWKLEGYALKANKLTPPSQLSPLRPPILQKYRPAQLFVLRRPVLQKCRPAIELIRQASRLPSCVFPRNWNQPAFEILFPEYAPLRKFARLMSASAIQEAQDGQTAQAIEDVGVIYRISEHVNSDPIFISLLVGNAIENVGHAALAQVFEYSNFTTAQKIQVEAILPRSDKQQQFARAMRGERAFVLSSFNDSYSTSFDTLNEFNSNNEGNPLWLQLLANSRVARMLWLPMFKLDAMWLLRAHPANAHPASLSVVPDYAFFTRIYLPVFERAYDAIRECETLRDLAQVALDLNVYHTQNKTYPATLAQLETQQKVRLPLDLFSGKPFVYRRTKNDYVLYSVGPNKTDDDGRTEQDSRMEDGSLSPANLDDITWPPHKRKS